MDSRPLVLIAGGYGVFGGRLARLLAARGDLRVVVAGRSLEAARAFCDALGVNKAEPLSFDRDADPATVLQGLKPWCVVDAAGPFQAYGDGDPYRFAHAALASGAHYLDLSDDAGFTAGIVQLDEAAHMAQRVAISGASTVPAISAAAVRSLREGLVRIESIESVVLPGNRAPRGLSVMRAILAQVGRPLRVWRGDAWTEVSGWSGLRRDALEIDGDVAPIAPRWSSYIGSPDLRLFPSAFGARSVLFRAGLELSLLHVGLWLLSWLPRLRLLRSLESWARALRWIAERFERFGSDRGGMRVEVIGRDAEGRALERTWTLIAERGEGPFVPALPAACLVDRLLRGELAVGARPCLDDLELSEIEAIRAVLPIRCGRSESAAETLYERVMGRAAWSQLPDAVRDAHDLFDQRVFVGEARITSGVHPLAWIVSRFMRFPPAIERTPVRVTMQRGRDGSETWKRQFGRHAFTSTLSRRESDPSGRIRERFGPMSFRLELPSDATGLRMPLERGQWLGIPLPRWLTPRSDTREFVDERGRFCFDVDISLPGLGRVVRYEGWLSPVTTLE